MSLRHTSILSAAAIVCMSFPNLGAATNPAPLKTQKEEKDRVVDFKRDVQPIFVKHCYKCHGPKKQESGFRLDRKADALTGGERGASIIPGESKKSLLIRYVAGLDEDVTMPPEDDELSKKQITTLRAWIDQGAKWPTKK